VPGEAELIESVKRVFDAAGHRYIAVRAVDGRLYRIGEDRLHWAWRLVFTREALGLAPFIAPVMLVIAQKARGVRVICGRCGRPHSASLFRTVQREVEDVYFTRCRRCWRSENLGHLTRQGSAPQLAPNPFPAGRPAETLSTRATIMVAVVLLGVVGGLFVLAHLH
jgi:hypothetical protein